MLVILARTLSATDCSVDGATKLGHHLLLFLLSSFCKYLLLFKSFQLLLLHNVVVQVLYVFVQVGLLADYRRVTDRATQIILLSVRLPGHWVLIPLWLRDIVITLTGTEAWPSHRVVWRQLIII